MKNVWNKDTSERIEWASRSLQAKEKRKKGKERKGGGNPSVLYLSELYNRKTLTLQMIPKIMLPETSVYK